VCRNYVVWSFFVFHAVHEIDKLWLEVRVGWWRWALVSPDGVAPSRMVGVSASVNLPLHHKVQKFSSGTGSPGWLLKKGRKTVVCVCVCVGGWCLVEGLSAGDTFWQFDRGSLAIHYQPDWWILAHGFPWPDIKYLISHMQTAAHRTRIKTVHISMWTVCISLITAR